MMCFIEFLSSELLYEFRLLVETEMSHKIKWKIKLDLWLLLLGDVSASLNGTLLFLRKAVVIMEVQESL